MRVYCKCGKLLTLMTIIDWDIDEDINTISYTYKCPKCENITKIYLDCLRDIMKNGVEKL